MLDLERIVILQKKLDESIHQKHQVTYKATFHHRKLALIVELAELANEVRSFKYWSLKPPSSREVILEEFVDCLHFCISLGIEMKVDFTQIVINENCNDDLNLLFIDTINSVVKLSRDCVESYIIMFNYLMNLANALEFNSEEIFNSYLDKNEKNHQRQDNNY